MQSYSWREDIKYLIGHFIEGVGVAIIIMSLPLAIVCDNRHLEGSVLDFAALVMLPIGFLWSCWQAEGRYSKKIQEELEDIKAELAEAKNAK